MVLVIDDGKQQREEPVEPQPDGLAPVVVLQQFLANLVDDDDPEYPGEEKACGEGGQRPVKRERTVVYLADPDAEIDGPRRDEDILGEIAVRVREARSNKLQSDKRDQKYGPMQARRGRVQSAVRGSGRDGCFLNTRLRKSQHNVTSNYSGICGLRTHKTETSC
jgi:hypothetical protein